MVCFAEQATFCSCWDWQGAFFGARLDSACRNEGLILPQTPIWALLLQSHRLI